MVLLALYQYIVTSQELVLIIEFITSLTPEKFLSLSALLKPDSKISKSIPNDVNLFENNDEITFNLYQYIAKNNNVEYVMEFLLSIKKAKFLSLLFRIDPITQYPVFLLLINTLSKSVNQQDLKQQDVLLKTMLTYDHNQYIQFLSLFIKNEQGGTVFQIICQYHEESFILNLLQTMPYETKNTLLQSADNNGITPFENILIRGFENILNMIIKHVTSDFIATHQSKINDIVNKSNNLFDNTIQLIQFRLQLAILDDYYIDTVNKENRYSDNFLQESLNALRISLTVDQAENLKKNNKRSLEQYFSILLDSKIMTHPFAYGWVISSLLRAPEQLFDCPKTRYQYILTANLCSTNVDHDIFNYCILGFMTMIKKYDYKTPKAQLFSSLKKEQGSAFLFALREIMNIIKNLFLKTKEAYLIDHFFQLTHDHNGLVTPDNFTSFLEIFDIDIIDLFFEKYIITILNNSNNKTIFISTILNFILDKIYPLKSEQVGVNKLLEHLYTKENNLTAKLILINSIINVMVVRTDDEQKKAIEMFETLIKDIPLDKQSDYPRFNEVLAKSYTIIAKFIIDTLKFNNETLEQRLPSLQKATDYISAAAKLTGNIDTHDYYEIINNYPYSQVCMPIAELIYSQRDADKEYRQLLIDAIFKDTQWPDTKLAFLWQIFDDPRLHFSNLQELTLLNFLAPTYFMEPTLQEKANTNSEFTYQWLTCVAKSRINYKEGSLKFHILIYSDDDNVVQFSSEVLYYDHDTDDISFQTQDGTLENMFHSKPILILEQEKPNEKDFQNMVLFYSRNITISPSILIRWVCEISTEIVLKTPEIEILAKLLLEDPNFREKCPKETIVGLLQIKSHQEKPIAYHLSPPTIAEILTQFHTDTTFYEWCRCHFSEEIANLMMYRDEDIAILLVQHSFGKIISGEAIFHMMCRYSVLSEKFAIACMQDNKHYAPHDNFFDFAMDHMCYDPDLKFPHDHIQDYKDKLNDFFIAQFFITKHFILSTIKKTQKHFNPTLEGKVPPPTVTLFAHKNSLISVIQQVLAAYLLKFEQAVNPTELMSILDTMIKIKHNHEHASIAHYDNCIKIFQNLLTVVKEYSAHISQRTSTLSVKNS